MKAVIVQARMGSSRLPGKVLKPINKIPMLKFLYDRLLKSKKIDKIIIATSSLDTDNPIEELCLKYRIPFFRGSENNVLERYYLCAKQFHIKTIIRVTADCPFIDPSLIDKMLISFSKSNLDYFANTVPPEKSLWPDGSDIEIFSFGALEKANSEAIESDDLEHVTFYFWKSKSKLFKIGQIKNNFDWSKYRFTVDYPEDYEVVLRINQKLNEKNQFGHIEEIVKIISDNKSISDLNSKYYFGIGWEQN